MRRSLESSRGFVAFAFAFVACSTSDGNVVAPSIDASGTAAPSLCASDTRGDAYRAGLEKAGVSGRFKVKLLNVSPNPVARGDNRWNIAVSDANGAAAAGATIRVVPLLVDHAKAAGQTPVVVADPLGGQYTVSRIELPIAGVWSFTFDITAKGASDTVVFTFCVDE
jgi:hypothetical protein